MDGDDKIPRSSSVPSSETPVDKEPVIASSTVVPPVTDVDSHQKEEDKEKPLTKQVEKLTTADAGETEVKQAQSSSATLEEKRDTKLSDVPRDEVSSEQVPAAEVSPTSTSTPAARHDDSNVAASEDSQIEDGAKGSEASTGGVESGSARALLQMDKDKNVEGEDDDDNDDTGNESDKTIDMDQSDVDKAFDKAAAVAACARQQTDGASSSSVKDDDGGDVDASPVVKDRTDDVAEKMDTTSKETRRQKDARHQKDASDKELAAKQGTDSRDLAHDEKKASPQECKGGKKKKQQESAADPRSPDDKMKEGNQSNSFHSFDLPLHPVQGRSRSRQFSEGPHPPARSPSIASNRSEESFWSSGKERKGSATEVSQRERKRSGASSKAESKSAAGPASTKMVRAGFEFRPGYKLEAMDFSKKW